MVLPSGGTEAGIEHALEACQHQKSHQAWRGHCEPFYTGGMLRTKGGGSLGCSLSSWRVETNTPKPKGSLDIMQSIAERGSLLRQPRKPRLRTQEGTLAMWGLFAMNKVIGPRPRLMVNGTPPLYSQKYPCLMKNHAVTLVTGPFITYFSKGNYFKYLSTIPCLRQGW